MNAQVRIIGGAWRSRRVVVPDVPGLRPTPDRVRETLFNWLGQTLEGMDCLDLFAGSGILGFEAVSRGAHHVTLIERDSRAWATLRHNAELLTVTQAVEIIRGDALEFLASATRQFDVAFIDPPYRQGWIERAFPLLDRVIPLGGRVYAEAEVSIAPPGWRVLRQSRAGQVHFHLLERQTT